MGVYGVEDRISSNSRSLVVSNEPVAAYLAMRNNLFAVVPKSSNLKSLLSDVDVWRRFCDDNYLSEEIRGALNFQISVHNDVGYTHS